MQEKLRRMVLCLALGLGSLIGAPMNPQEIEELMRQMNQPKIAREIPDDADRGGEPPGRYR
jgi:hypothetical protein